MPPHPTATDEGQPARAGLVINSRRRRVMRRRRVRRAADAHARDQRCGYERGDRGALESLGGQPAPAAGLQPRAKTGRAGGCGHRAGCAHAAQCTCSRSPARGSPGLRRRQARSRSARSAPAPRALDRGPPRVAPARAGTAGASARRSPRRSWRRPSREPSPPSARHRSATQADRAATAPPGPQRSPAGAGPRTPPGPGPPMSATRSPAAACARCAPRTSAVATRRRPLRP